MQYVPCYKIDPENDRPVCPLEPHKPYDESICRVLEVSIENEVRSILDEGLCTDVRIPPDRSGTTTNLQNESFLELKATLALDEEYEKMFNELSSDHLKRRKASRSSLLDTYSLRRSRIRKSTTAPQ